MKKLLVVLMAVMAITSLMVAPAFAGDKLIVKDSATPTPNTVFVVQDTGFTGIGTPTPSNLLSLSYNNADVNIPAIKVNTSSTSVAPLPQAVMGFYVGDVLKGKIRFDGLGNMGIEATGTGNIAYNWSGAAGDVRYFNGSGGLLAVIKNNGRLGLGVANPSYPIQVSNGAYLSAGGQWVSVSTRDAKKDIKNLSAADAMTAFEKLKPVTYTYKTVDEHHVGFIAEDVPSLVATKDRKGLSSLDIVAVLTKVVQEQQKTIEQLTEKVNLLEGKVSKINNSGSLSSVIP